MESERPVSEPDDPRAGLALADEGGRRFAAALRLPTGLFPALAAAIAVQVGAAAYGIAEQSGTGLAVALAGAAVFLAVAAGGLRRFRRINGVRVDGLASQVVLGAGPTATCAYLTAFAAATWAAFDDRWWVVAVAAVAGGAGYAWGALGWWRSYQRDPAARAGGTSPRVFAALTVVVALGLVALVAVG